MSDYCTVCAVPLYVSAQAIESHSVNVTWSVAEEDAEGVIHYEVRWSLLAADKDDIITTTTMTIRQEGNASSVLITDLLPAMEYSIQVRALATAGWGQWSHQVRARTGPAGKQQHVHIKCVLCVYTHIVKLPPCTANTISSTVPGQVTDLLATNSSTTSVTVTWNLPTVYKGHITMHKVRSFVYICVHTYILPVMECS